MHCTTRLIAGLALSSLSVGALARSPEESWQISGKVALTTIGSFEVGAYCEDDTGLAFSITNRSPGLVLKRSPVSSPQLGSGQQGSITRSCVVMPVRVGAGQVQNLASESCEDDTNVTVGFVGNLVKKAQQDGRSRSETISKLGPSLSQGSRNDPGIGALQVLNSAMVMLQSQGASPLHSPLGPLGIAQMKDVLTANQVTIQLPFTNGKSSTIEIHPQEPTLKEYISQCAPACLGGKIKARARDGFYFVDETREYRGTADHFISALPGLVQHAAAVSGLPLRNYDKEVAYIAEVVRTCVSAAPQLAAAYGKPGYGPLRVRTGCWAQDVSQKVGSIGNGRGLGVGVDPVLNAQHRRDWLAGFTVSVGFGSLGSDLADYLAGTPCVNRANPGLTKFVGAGSYNVVQATIGQELQDLPSPQSGPEKFQSLSAIPMTERQYSGTLEGFAEKLPSYVARAASVAGLAPHDYSEEFAYVVDAVRACAQKAPAKNAFASVRTGSKLRTIIASCDGRATPVPRSFGTYERTLYLIIKPTQDANDKSFAVGVYFRAFPNDPRPQGSAAPFIDDTYGIVFSKIDASR